MKDPRWPHQASPHISGDNARVAAPPVQQIRAAHKGRVEDVNVTTTGRQPETRCQPDLTHVERMIHILSGEAKCGRSVLPSPTARPGRRIRPADRRRGQGCNCRGGLEARSRPAPKSNTAGTGSFRTISPSERTSPIRSAIPAALATEPRENPPVTLSPSRRATGCGVRVAVCTAIASLGTTSQPTPGTSITPAAAAANRRVRTG